MDINTIRGLATLVALIAFLSVVIWAYSSRRKNDFDKAAALPFVDDSKAVLSPGVAVDPDPPARQHRIPVVLKTAIQKPLGKEEQHNNE